MFFSRSLKYLNYKLLSRHRNGHGIHSPFVFDLVTRVFRNQIDAGIVNNIEQIRKKLINDTREIEVLDLGAGSVRSDNYKRSISGITRYSPVTRKYGKLLSKLAAEFGNNSILELGTSVGISAMYLASARPDVPVYTIEGSKEIADIAKQNFLDSGLGNIRLMVGSFDDVLPELIKEGVKPGLVFIDGNHRKIPVIKYFNMIAGISDSSAVIVVDDINYSQEMHDAWNELKLNPEVTASIDIYRMGILFFRRGITRNHYIIRY